MFLFPKLPAHPAVLTSLAFGGAVIGGAFALAPLRERLTPRELAGGTNFVTVGGYELHYTDDGPRDAPVVLLIHGFWAWAFTWRHLRDALVAAGLRVITVDQLGSGASERPAAPVYSTQMQANLITGVLDTLGVQQAALVGHSFGGRVALLMAATAPERFRSLVLLNAEAFATERPPIARWLEVPLFGYALAFYSTAPFLVRTGLELVTKQHDWITDAVIEGYAAPIYVQGSALAQAWIGRSPKDGAVSVPTLLSSLSQRTLIVWGGDDAVFPASDGEKLAGILPNATLHVLPGVGHLPHEEARAEVERLARGFLSG